MKRLGNLILQTWSGEIIIFLRNSIDRLRIRGDRFLIMEAGNRVRRNAIFRFGASVIGGCMRRHFAWLRGHGPIVTTEAGWVRAGRHSSRRIAFLYGVGSGSRIDKGRSVGSIERAHYWRRRPRFYAATSTAATIRVKNWRRCSDQGGDT